MRIESYNDRVSRTSKLLVSVDERDLLLFRHGVEELVRNEIASRVADLVWKTVEPKLIEALSAKEVAE